MRFASSTSCAAVSSGWRPASRRNSCSASVVVSWTIGCGGGGGGGGCCSRCWSSENLDAALLELAVDRVRLERVELQRLENLDEIRVPKRPILLGRLEQLVQLGGRQDVVDFNRSHPD